MSTGMQHGIALPHGKSDGIDSMSVAVGARKAGVDFDSLDHEPSRLFILIASPKKESGPHVQFLAAISSILKDKGTVEKNPRGEIAGQDRGDPAELRTIT